jgi:hypothetical protein
MHAFACVFIPPLNGSCSLSSFFSSICSVPLQGFEILLRYTANRMYRSWIWSERFKTLDLNALREWGSFSLYLRSAVHLKNLEIFVDRGKRNTPGSSPNWSNIVYRQVSYFGARITEPHSQEGSSSSTTNPNAEHIGVCISLEPGLVSIFQQYRQQLESLYSQYAYSTHAVSGAVASPHALNNDTYLSFGGLLHFLQDFHVRVDTATTQKCFDVSRSGGSAPPGYISFPEFSELLCRLSVALSTDTKATVAFPVVGGGNSEICLRHLLYIIDKDETLFPENLAALRHLRNYYEGGQEDEIAEGDCCAIRINVNDSGAEHRYSRVDEYQGLDQLRLNENHPVLHLGECHYPPVQAVANGGLLNDPDMASRRHETDVAPQRADSFVPSLQASRKLTAKCDYAKSAASATITTEVTHKTGAVRARIL